MADFRAIGEAQGKVLSLSLDRVIMNPLHLAKSTDNLYRSPPILHLELPR